MSQPRDNRDFSSVADLLNWSYSNLAMAHYAVTNGLDSYDRVSFAIRSRLYKGLTSEKMHIRSLFDDERWKISNGAKCVYCGAVNDLSVDHVFSRINGRTDEVENLVCSCKTCNSSKGKKDMMEWYASKGGFPSVMMLRRYLKLVFQQCAGLGILELPIQEATNYSLPFQLSNIPTRFPAPNEILIEK